MASAQASGVRKAAMPCVARSRSASSACGVMKTVSGFFSRAQSTIGLIASSGCNCAEEPIVARMSANSGAAMRMSSAGRMTS